MLMKAQINKFFTLLTILTLGISNVWAGVTIFSSVSQETTDGTWTITGSSNSASNQSNVVFPDPAVETGFPVGKVTASTAYYCKLSSSGDKGAKLGTAKRITIGGLSAGDSIVVYWFATSTTSGKLCLSYATGASAGSYIEEVSLGTIVTKQLYATSFKALTATDIDHIENGYSGSAKLAYISSNGPSPYVYAVKIIAGSVTKHTVTYDLNGGGGTTPTQADVAENAKFTLHDGTTGITAPDNKIFDGWNDGSTTYAGGAEYTMGTSDVTLTAQWASAHTVSFVANGGGSSMASVKVKDGVTYTIPVCGFTPEDANHTFSHWAISGVAGKTEGDPDETFTMPAGDVTLTAQWTASYAVTEGTHANGSITIDPTSAAEGATITLTATPNANYLFGAWDVYKTGESSTKVAVTNNQFTMPAYPVTVNATFVADTRPKVLLLVDKLTGGNWTGTGTDKLYAALKDDYNITVAVPEGQTLTNYDLIILHESIGGTNTNAAVTGCKTTSVPVLNTKTYFYGGNNDATSRWQWGAPNGGQSIKGCTINAGYCNIASHPIFTDVTISEGFVEIINTAEDKCMQPVIPVEGKEGYLLATSPNAATPGGNGYAIQEIPAGGFRGATSGKYLLISASNGALSKLNANGQKLFQNAAAYLIGSTTWTPIVAPTSPEVTATPSENYTEGNTITLTASATGTSASTTYTWYKGDNWAAASATAPVQAASTSGATYTKTAAVEDAGTYWCNISNGTSCDVQASVTITVSSASAPTHTITYDNLKGVDVSAYPTEYTEGVGVASFAPLADITGWHFVEWSPASIAADETEDPKTITAVWKQIFEVTFNMQDHGDAIDAQNIVDGGKVTAPTAPTATDYDFGGWYKEAGCTNAWDFANDVVTEATVLYAKWTVDPCLSSERKSLSKVVLTSTTEGTVTGYNSDEYAGTAVIESLKDDGTTADIIGDATQETGYKLNNGGKSIVFATLAKGDFQEGDRVIVGVIKKNDQRTVDESTDILTIYAGSDKDHILEVATVKNVSTPGFYTYRLTAANVTAINDAGYKSIGVFRASDNGENHYIYSVEIQGCRSWAIMHTLTFKNIDGTATIAAEPLEEGAYASTVAPAAPKITMKRFLGWAETIDGTPIDLTSYTITEDKTLYAVYEDIVCPTTGTVYKFQLKTDLTNGNIFTSAPGELTLNTTDHLSSMVNGEVTVNLASGKNTNRVQFYDGKAIGFANGDGASITLTLDCALATGDEIRFINYAGSGNKMNLSDGAHSLELNGNNAETVQKITVNSDWNGADELTLTRGGNTPKLTYFEIYRPAKFDVSFDMMGHGSAIADIEDVVEGSKIVAPDPAPTDVDYSFAGWYKENTLENEWDFDNDVVNAATTLYAKWLDKTDATLKSLKYGDEDITLVDGIYTYNISLPAFTSAVPALTAVPNNPNATAVPTNAAAFDGEGNATSTVLVTPESGTPQTYTVNFSKGVEVTLQDVTGSITWDFANAVSTTVNITGTPQVLANYGGVTNIVNVFESDKLEASGEKFTAGSKANLRAKTIHFHTTVPGMLSISYSNTGGTNPARYIYVNGVKYDNDGSANTTPKGIDNKVFVPAGDVYLEMKDGEDAPQNIQVYKIIFNDQADYTRVTTEGRYGTICLPNGGVMVGAELYEVAYYGATSQKVFLDQIPSGEMVAGRPYIFLPNEGASQLGVFYTDAANADAGSHNGLIGSYTKEPIAANVGNYILLNNQYCPVESTVDPVYVGANKAYIKLADITPVAPALKPGAKRVGLGVAAPQTPTDIDNLNATDAPVKVMINGQMYILRGEKMYNANGQLVK